LGDLWRGPRATASPRGCFRGAASRRYWSAAVVRLIHVIPRVAFATYDFHCGPLPMTCTVPVSTPGAVRLRWKTLTGTTLMVACRSSFRLRSCLHIQRVSSEKVTPGEESPKRHRPSGQQIQVSIVHQRSFFYSVVCRAPPECNVCGGRAAMITYRSSSNLTRSGTDPKAVKTHRQLQQREQLRLHHRQTPYRLVNFPHQEL